MSARKRHPLRRVFDEAERAVGRPLEEAVNTPAGGSVLFLAAKITGFGFRQAQAVRAKLVHLAELPTHRDVDVLSAKVSRLQGSIEEISQQLADLEEQQRP